MPLCVCLRGLHWCHAEAERQLCSIFGVPMSCLATPVSIIQTQKPQAHTENTRNHSDDLIPSPLLCYIIAYYYKDESHPSSHGLHPGKKVAVTRILACVDTAASPAHPETKTLLCNITCWLNLSQCITSLKFWGCFVLRCQRKLT